MMVTAKEMYAVQFGNTINSTFASWYIPMIQEWLDHQDVNRPLNELLDEFQVYLDECEAKAELMEEP